MMTSFVWNATKACHINSFSINCLLIPLISEDILNELNKHLKFMSTQNSKNQKREEPNSTEWLDELINKIESMKNKISNTY